MLDRLDDSVSQQNTRDIEFQDLRQQLALVTQQRDAATATLRWLAENDASTSGTRAAATILRIKALESKLADLTKDGGK